MISIVIPTLNNFERLKDCLLALEAQDYPREKMEIIVVDNGSTDGSQEYLNQGDYVLLIEAEKSPYKARNKGILAAKHDIIALLDSNCKPRKQWVSAGLKTLAMTENDIVCGPINFTFSNPPTITEIADSMVFVSNKVSVEDGKSIPTGQLFTTKKVFTEVGLFMDKIRSGGDIEWSERATKIGFKLGYASEAIVNYPAKKYKNFIKKGKRIGKGRVQMRNLKNKSKGISWWIHTLIISRPPSPFSLRRRLINNKIKLNPFQFIRVWWMTWVYRLVRGYNMIR